MSEIKLSQAKELAANFAQGVGVKDKDLFIQNAILISQEKSTADFEFLDVLKCLLKAERYGVSLVTGEASMFPVNCKVGNEYVKKPLLIIDYKWEWQQILQNGDCESLNIVPVLQGDDIRRSLIGHEWSPSDDIEGNVIGYYGYYKGKSGIEVGLYMSKELILKKIPENNRNSMYKGDDSKSEWLFKKMILRQLKKQVPNTKKLEISSKAEEIDQEEFFVNEKPVAKASKKLPIPEPAPFDDEDSQPY